MTGTLDRVTDFALNLSAHEMPDSAKEAAALMMLDTMGILIASGPMEAGVIARDTAALLYASTDAAFSVPMMFDGRLVNGPSRSNRAGRRRHRLQFHTGCSTRRPVKVETKGDHHEKTFVSQVR